MLLAVLEICRDVHEDFIVGKFGWRRLCETEAM